MTPEFLMTALIVVMLPGTGVLYTLSAGLGQGARASVIAALGCTLGIVPHIAASILGLAALLHTSAVLFETVRYLGVAYLFYLAWRILQKGGTLAVPDSKEQESSFRLVTNAILLNVLNPKLSLFFVAFLPQFVPADAIHPSLTMLELAAVFMAMTLVVFILYGACAALARDYVLSSPRVLQWLRRSFAAAFAMLGLKLALADR
ncbi:MULTISPECIES: LysE family translocator [unclassified Hwanghaeella]|jgi:threonine/homoserine/homoserine lactone efflux protein|uniref:LysE family translocator n=1 Tax=unclassified Hwanghaeella TaxID=2605944 RepID=UPI000C974AB1|nr:lysine transporter LysE [Rhodospirillales bacterium]|tara:strand:- start:3335 stop:3946 length:612 start_codon:yes stop_codon:yes gene_type:complete